jgi:hypothetical protein
MEKRNKENVKMDKKAIKKALDHFENDEYVDAQEIIKKEIAGKRDVFIKDKLGLSQDINPVPDSSDEKEGEGEEEGQVH